MLDQALSYYFEMASDHVTVNTIDLLLPVDFGPQLQELIESFQRKILDYICKF